MIALGIDPGSRRTGFGLVEERGSRIEVLDAGVLKVRERDPLHTRLGALHAAAVTLLAERPPDIVGVETVFHGVNTQSLVALGQARGALLAAIGATGLPLIELSPAEIKKALTGRGGAAKHQVALMVGAVVGAPVGVGEGGPWGLDATDGLAVAIATLRRARLHAAAERMR